MLRISDPLPLDAATLVDIITEGHRLNAGRWPVWQYVQHQMDQAGYDAAQALEDLPRWTHQYGPTWSDSGHGIEPGPGDRIAVTVGGLGHASGHWAGGFCRAFLAAMHLAAVRQREVQPHPDRAENLVLQGAPLVRAVNMRASTSLSDDQLLGILKREPITAGGIQTNTDSVTWSWDVTRLRTHAFREATDIQDLLAALDEALGTRSTVHIDSSPVPHAALTDAFDHLDLAWRSIYSEKLLQVNRLGVIASMIDSVDSRETFDSRCTALTDVLSTMRVPARADAPQAGTLHRLRLSLTDSLKDDQHPAIRAIGTLQHVVAVRNAAGHPSSAHKQEPAFVALDLDHVRGDWEKSWNIVVRRTVEALREIRNGVLQQEAQLP
ncbi:hypothetical protein LL946_10835 [Knoellia locipacati]|uniref:hypothetical protein n=1 Tax=Knoellia locipacati TaxID=882824 RepID=UPI00384A6901